jgi:DNA mismatch repair protein MutS2
VLTRLDEQRQEMEREKEEAARLRRESETYNEKIKTYQAQLEKEKEKAAERARAEAKAILDEARAAADAAFKELNEMRRMQERQQADWQEQNDRRAALRRSLNEAEEILLGKEEELPTPPPTRPAVAGDTVEHLRLRVRAEVTAVNKDGTLALRAGAMKLNARQDEVRVVENGSIPKGKPKTREPRQTVHAFNPAAAPMELDLRGMESLEAISSVDMFLDNALRSKLETVRIIHGKGTGVLRKAVRDHLKRSKYVKQFRPGIYGEGEDGVTVVTLK